MSLHGVEGFTHFMTQGKICITYRAHCMTQGKNCITYRTHFMTQGNIAARFFSLHLYSKLQNFCCKNIFRKDR